VFINLIGQANATGVGNHFGSFASALESVCGPVHLAVRVLGTDPDVLAAFCRERPTETQASIFFWGGFAIDVAKVLSIAGRKIIWCVFEQTILPPAWINGFDRFDEIWVPSIWGRDVLIDNGIDSAKIVVMPEGVDSTVFLPKPQAHAPYRFLTVGKYEGRKSIDETVDAFFAAFPRDDHGVELWLKCDYFGRPDRTHEFAQKFQGDPRIKVIYGEMTKAALADLYHQCDAFVFASKAEGFGLAGLEAIACGLPLLAVNYSGQTAFLEALDGAFLPIAYDLKPLIDPDYEAIYRKYYGRAGLGVWAIPRLESMIVGMRQLRAERDQWCKIATEKSAAMRAQFDWQAIARKALGHLEGQMAEGLIPAPFSHP
jgi:glycosyltransferase involved in cell wall biosynthesis